MIRIDLDSRLTDGRPVVVELGCGTAPTTDAIGVDRLDLPGVDIVADIEDGLGFLPDASVDVLRATSVLEHITDLDLLVREAARVLKRTGRFEVFVPHFSNPYHYSDPTHVRSFGLYTFGYYADGRSPFRRRVPQFYNELSLVIVRQELVFASPFRGRNYVKKALGRLVNLSMWATEFYEENLPWLLPCYGIRVVLAPANARGGAQVRE
jgi:SAM-dependent methyltransferase